MQATPFVIDLDVFAEDIGALRKRLKASVGPDDLQHFQRIELFTRAMFYVGLATCWMTPNLLSIMALAIASFARWTILSHHISHKGYDQVPAAPERYKSIVYAKGWRRYIDWFDWMLPEAWHYEHNILHHFNLGEVADPDVPQHNSYWIRDMRVPVFFKKLYILLGTMVWKATYYGPNTLNCLINKACKAKGEPQPGFWSVALWSPLNKRFWLVVRHSWLPYAAFRFGVLPAIFLPLGVDAWENALITLVIAEVISNVWSFWVIVPNHAGSDVYHFDEPAKNRAEFYLHQVAGSVNFTTGGNVNDFLHGWLNYQIEHHLFPDLTCRQYQLAQPEVKAICEKHGVPYVQESIFKRMNRCLNILAGTETQTSWPGIVHPNNSAGQKASVRRVGQAEERDLVVGEPALQS